MTKTMKEQIEELRKEKGVSVVEGSKEEDSSESTPKLKTKRSKKDGKDTENS